MRDGEFHRRRELAREVVLLVQLSDFHGHVVHRGGESLLESGGQVLRLIEEFLLVLDEDANHVGGLNHPLLSFLEQVVAVFFFEELGYGHVLRENGAEILSAEHADREGLTELHHRVRGFRGAGAGDAEGVDEGLGERGHFAGVGVDAFESHSETVVGVTDRGDGLLRSVSYAHDAVEVLLHGLASSHGELEPVREVLHFVGQLGELLQARERESAFEGVGQEIHVVREGLGILV